jgi:hypothetical protein
MTRERLVSVLAMHELVHGCPWLMLRCAGTWFGLGPNGPPVVPVLLLDTFRYLRAGSRLVPQGLYSCCRSKVHCCCNGMSVMVLEVPPMQYHQHSLGPCERNTPVLKGLLLLLLLSL